ncbi:MAG: 5-formyltetrahydrofolate cyclo-ligase [Sphingobacteriaceae bacterium]|nr:5-formyltetrahydrofolate cyclo-ligase [Sphingobacteriaceae bacterium]
MIKSEIRKKEILKRKNLSEKQLFVLNEQLLVNFQKLDFSTIQTIHLFLPIAEKNEPNTFLIINWLKENHPNIKIIVPKADFETCTLQNFEYQEGNLIKSDYQILEPFDTPLYNGNIDMVLVPLLAFDKRGYRVGYGKGFYDRFLSKIKTIKIGISFFEAYEKISDADCNDIKLNSCITPSEIIQF